jgi:hypothetical protein
MSEINHCEKHHWYGMGKCPFCAHESKRERMQGIEPDEDFV